MTPERRTELVARIERALDLPMLILSALFLIIVVALETIPVTPTAATVLEGLLWIIWGVFAVELLVKMAIAPDRKRFLLTHWIDVLTVALPLLRPLRLVRVMVVVGRSWEQARRVLRRRTFSLIGVVSLVTVVVSATLVYAVERNGDGPIDTIADAVWWAMVTITTIGYGDMYPVTTAGRGVAVFLMLTGISMFSLLTARVAAFLVEGEQGETEQAKLNEIIDRLERIERQLAEHEQPRP